MLVFADIYYYLKSSKRHSKNSKFDLTHIYYNKEYNSYSDIRLSAQMGPPLG